MSDQEWRYLEQVKQGVLNQLERDTVHSIYMLALEDDLLDIYVFYKTNDDVRNFHSNGFSQQVTNLIERELDSVGRGKSYGVRTMYEFDSHENVVENFEGNYYLRLK